MPRKPKPKNTLSAGERAKLYEAELQEKQKRMRFQDDNASEIEITAHEQNQTSAVDVEIINEPSIPQVTQKPKRELPKPPKALVKVDFSIPTGEIKPLHGMCNGPLSYGADITNAFREIGVPYVRFDCTDTAMSACAVDVSRIFKNPYADLTDEEGYDFSTTDRYVEAALLSGAKVIFRLGESCDMLRNDRAKCRLAPDDLIKVCVNIIKHFNDRWASGYSYGIEYFELWNLAPESSGNEREADFETYRRLANAIKLYDENIKVGGISFDGFDGAREFLRFCNRTRTPVDFITVDVFDGDVEVLGKNAEKFSSFIRNSGMNDLEIMIGKWSYIDLDVLGSADLSKTLSGSGEKNAELKKQIFTSQCSVKGAAFAAALMLRLNSVQMISAACHFDAQPMVSPFCSITDRFGDSQKPFYAFKAYGDLYRARKAVFCESEQLEGFAHTGIYASAALSDFGEGYLMIASFGGCGTVDVRLDGIPDDLYTADVYMLDGVKNMTLADSIPLSGTKKRLVLNVSEYGAMLIKLY